VSGVVQVVVGGFCSMHRCSRAPAEAVANFDIRTAAPRSSMSWCTVRTYVRIAIGWGALLLFANSLCTTYLLNFTIAHRSFRLYVTYMYRKTT